MKNVKEPNDILVAGTFGYDRSANSTTNWKETVISGLTENVILADIDNDGYLDILADTSRLFGNHFEPNEVVGYWKVQDLPLLQGIPANEAPQRMAAPSIKPRPQERQTEDCLAAGKGQGDFYRGFDLCPPHRQCAR